jgi:lipoprotein-anchoring transpeptidase ErfK/SrfK
MVDFAQMRQRQSGRCVMNVVFRGLAVLAAAVAFSVLSLPVFTVAAAAHETVSFDGGQAPGTIVVRTSERRLYYVIGKGQAVRYPVGVGRAGRQWAGKSIVDGKYIRPDWAPPADIIRDHPRIARLIPGGSSKNPMGAAALTLSGGEYAIHGTNNPGSIGGFVSYGCIRMYNADIMDLFSRVSVGTPVEVAR